MTLADSPDSPDSPDAAIRLGAACARLTRGLYYPGSESDSPFHAFDAPFDTNAELRPETFRAALGLASWWRVDFQDGASWFVDIIARLRDPRQGADPDVARAYELLRAVMEATLEAPLILTWIRADRHVIRFHRTRRYVFGRVPGGGLAGVLALSVET